MKKEEIKNDTFVYDTNLDAYFIVAHVGNSREKGDRGVNDTYTPNDELSFSIVNIVTGYIDSGICENSDYCMRLRVATIDEIKNYLGDLEEETRKIIIDAKSDNDNIKQVIAKFERKINASIEKQTSSQILNNFIWDEKNELPRSVFTGTFEKGFVVDQSVLLRYLVKFQDWIFEQSK